MLGSAIAAAESRLGRSRADLGAHLDRLGIALARPAALAGAAGVAALMGFCAAHLRANALTSALAAAFRIGLSRYVRQRTVQGEVRSQDAGHG
jgi:hypothetical protein